MPVEGTEGQTRREGGLIMRKVFLVLMALSLTGLMVACSDDDTPVIPEPTEFGITTAAITTGYTCTPYNIQLEAEGGTAPYTWSLAPGSTLPDGMALTSDGRIMGLLEDMGSWNFSVVCTDAAGTPNTDQVDFTLDVEVPANPSVAIFYDGDATVCGGETTAFTPLDCYVFIMLEGGGQDCTWGTEFQITIEDVNGDPLSLGTQYTHSYVSFTNAVSVTIGDPFSGVAVSFNREMIYGIDGDVHVATFGLLLLEDLDNLTFKVGPSPSSGNSRPIITTCDVARSVVEVNGRAAALNYSN
jgi:hypothetical protein